ncbi:MAG TPA: hypothetical protein VK047_12420 [Zeimonas sp.]|nr:hypothetical protein [Zeimonas sp.]
MERASHSATVRRRPALSYKLAFAAVLAATVFSNGVVPPAEAAPVESLGAALYESRCTGCHERSVHSREPRRAGSFDHIRAYVYRWDRFLGGSWRRDEIDAVAQYLNERYYHFPCPPEVCGVALR